MNVLSYHIYIRPFINERKVKDPTSYMIYESHLFTALLSRAAAGDIIHFGEDVLGPDILELLVPGST